MISSNLIPDTLREIYNNGKCQLADRMK